MTVSQVATSVIYNGNGATLLFDIPWPFAAASDIRVAYQPAAGEDNETLILNTDYAVTGDLVAGFKVNFTGLMGAPPAGSTIVVSRREAALQTTPFNDSVRFPAARVAAMGDKLARAIQDVKDEQGLFFRLSDSDLGRLGPLPPLSGAVGKFFTFVADAENPGNFLISFSPSVAAVEATAAIANQILAVANISASVVIVAAGSTPANIATVAGSIGSVNTVAGAIGSVNTVAGAIAAVNAVGGSIGSVNAVASQIAAVLVNASNIADIIECADNILVIQAAPQAAIDAATARDDAQNAAAATVGLAQDAQDAKDAAETAATNSDASADLALGYLALTAEAAATAIGSVFGPAFIAKSRTTAAQPGAPANLDTYILPATPTGAQWGGFAQHDVVRWTTNGNVWVRVAPSEGWEAYIQDANEKVRFDGAAWGVAVAAALNEDNFASKSATQAPSQLSLVNYILGPKRRPARDFGILTNTENMAPWETMVSALAAGDVYAVDWHPGLYVFDDQTALSAIVGPSTSSTEDFISLRGIPGATRFQMAAGAGTVGTFFKLGSAPNFLRRFLIDGFDLSYLNSPDPAQAAFELQLARDGIISRINGRGWGKALKTTQAGLMLLDQWNIELGAQAGAADAIFDFNNTSVKRLHRLDVNGFVPGNLDPDGCFVSIQSGGSGANIDTFEMQSCGFQLYSKVGSAADGRPVGLRIRKPAGDSGSVTNVWMRESFMDHTTVAAVDALIDAASTNSNSRVIEITGNRFATDSGKGATFDNQSTDLIGNAYAGLTIDGNTFIIQTNAPAVEIKGALWNNVEIINNKFRDRFGLTADRFNDIIDHVIAVAAPNVKIEGNTVTSDDGNGYVRAFDGSSASVVSTANDTLTLSSVTTFNPTGTVNTGTDLFTMAGLVFQNNQKLRYRKGAGGTVMAGLTDDSDVYVRDWDYNSVANTTTFKLAATEGGAAINITSLGAGTAHELIVGHGYDTGMQLEYSAGGGTVVTGLTEGQIYIPRDITADTLKLNEGGAAAIDLTALGVGAAHTLKLKTRFRAFVKATGAGVSNLHVGSGNKVDCLTYFDEATYPTVPYGNNRILDPKIIHENNHREWQTYREFFDEIASGTTTQPNSRRWNTAKGSDGSTILPYIDGAAERGLLTFDIKNTATKTMAVNGVQMVGPLVYRSQRGLVIEADLTHNDVNDAALFFGFTDQNSALEMPMEHNGAAVIATATDAVGWLFDTNFSTNNWRCVAAANGVVRNFDSGRLHVNSVYQILRIEIDYRGNADFFLNKVHVGHITTAVTPSVALAPYWGGYSRNGGYFARMDEFKIAMRSDKPA